MDLSALIRPHLIKIVVFVLPLFLFEDEREQLSFLKKSKVFGKGLQGFSVEVRARELVEGNVFELGWRKAFGSPAKILSNRKEAAFVFEKN